MTSIRWFVLAMTLAPTLPLAAQTSLTIYNDGRVLQRRVMPVAVPAGSSVHQLLLGQLDPGSLFALDSGVVITGSRYDPAVDLEMALSRASGYRAGTGSTPGGSLPSPVRPRMDERRALQGRYEDATLGEAERAAAVRAEPETAVAGPSARAAYRRLYRAVAVTDGVTVGAALLLAYWLRFGFRFPQPYFLWVLVGTPVVMVLMYQAFHLYDAYRYTPAEEFRRIILAVSMGLFAVLANMLKEGRLGVSSQQLLSTL